MISKFLNVRRTRQGLLCFTALVGFAGLAAAPSARAVTTIQPDSAVPNDTFSIEVVGYNTANPAANDYLINPLLAPNFGTTQAFAGGALNNQTLVVSSNEIVNNGFITDFISLNVPSNFVPAGTVDHANEPLNAIQFSIGNYLGGTDPLNLSPAVSAYTATGSVTFNFSGVNISNAVPLTSMNPGGTAFSAFGLVYTADGSDISNSQVSAFSFSLTYAAPVPEPSMKATLALGALGLFFVVRRRARA